jgi:hypothetical protein
MPEFRNVRCVRTYQVPPCEVTEQAECSSVLHCAALYCVWTGASASYTSGHRQSLKRAINQQKLTSLARSIHVVSGVQEGRIRGLTNRPDSWRNGQ